MTPAQEAEVRAIMAAIYLPRGAAPNSLAILPAPPEPGSAAQARDDAAALEAQALRGTPRFALAASDADLSLPHAIQAFTCALGVEVSEAATPHTYTLLRRTMADIGLSTYPTKTKYQRTRPFVVTSTPTCTPDDEAFLRHDGSYPSGHSAIGWGWALVLTEVAPERQNEILARGRAFGQSRVVCNVHWLSDTEEGRVMASATVARLQSAPEFRADLEAARAEITAARAAGSAPTNDCAAEAAQLAG
ncbi:phosphatase PAP2 family protein [Brevundimonas lenta]